MTSKLGLNPFIQTLSTSHVYLYKSPFLRSDMTRYTSTPHITKTIYQTIWRPTKTSFLGQRLDDRPGPNWAMLNIPRRMMQGKAEPRGSFPTTIVCWNTRPLPKHQAELTQQILFNLMIIGPSSRSLGSRGIGCASANGLELRSPSIESHPDCDILLTRRLPIATDPVVHQPPATTI